MASKSLGTLTLDLIARIGAFTGPLDKASQAAKKRSAEMTKSFDNLAKGVGVAIGSIPATLTAFVATTVSSAKEISNLSAIAGLGTTAFQRYAAGASTVGINQEKLSDIFKDVNDKFGDFLNTGAGPLADFFTNIAPKVGLTAENFKKLNAADALQLYVSSLEKANASQKEMTFYLEAIAGDSTALLPLLKNGGAAFTQLGDAAEAAGSILSLSTIAVSKEFSAELTTLQQSLIGAKNGMANEFLPVLLQFAKDTNDATGKAGGLGDIVKQTADIIVKSSAFIVNAGDGVVRVFDIMANTLVGMYGSAAGRILNLASQANTALSFITLGDTSAEFKADAKEMADAAQTQFSIAAQAAQTIKEDLETPLAGDRFKDYVAAAKSAAAEMKMIDSAAAGAGTGVDPAAIKAREEAAKKAASAAVSAAKKIQDSFESTETDLKRQIDLINTSTDARKEATEAAKIQFEFESGELAGLNNQQKERLKGLAEELDKRRLLKQVNEDDKTVREFQGSVDHQLTIDQRALDAPFLNAYDTDEVKQRTLDMLAIEQDYQDQLEELRLRHEVGDISDSVYDRETEILEAALETRLEKQQKYYQDLDALQRNGTAGLISGFATQAEASMDLYGTMQSVGADTFHNLTDAISEWAETGKLDAKGLAASFIQSVGHALLSYAAAQVAMAGLSAFTAMIGIPFVGPVVAPSAAIAATAAAGVMMTAVGAALDGQAHDGIDYVPADGTWNLKKGERVTTAETSAKLDRTLDRVSKDTPGGSGLTVNLIEDKSKAGQSERGRNSDGSEFLNLWAAQIRAGGNDTSDTLESAYGLRRNAG
ncbi:phage tail tape measure protein [Pseudomonas fluorescens]|uniref:Bacteriophage tail tape measure C-terminal domain-containing protein n=1 Tax=Pseudomonas fluorescens TaxID=294 RepID=A0A5E7A5A1_PSEFL|nr:phage tail tape measure C-terminal domain-containing protein [Pseudomonas fluorescens]VVN73956.1 hypothetical protein PS710_00618 [Pseudomonas fluorescens]